jgi:hypothetical protein
LSAAALTLFRLLSAAAAHADGVAQADSPDFTLDTTGVPLWTNRYNGPGNDTASAGCRQLPLAFLSRKIPHLF